jgi:hypothetical protein
MADKKKKKDIEMLIIEERKPYVTSNDKEIEAFREEKYPTYTDTETGEEVGYPIEGGGVPYSTGGSVEVRGGGAAIKGKNFKGVF